MRCLLAWAGLAAFAVTAVPGATWAVVDPGERSFVVGSLMAFPVLAATALP